MEREKINLMILDVQREIVKTYGPMSESLVIKWLVTNFNDQPLGRVNDNPRIYIADLETGNVIKPSLKLAP